MDYNLIHDFVLLAKHYSGCGELFVMERFDQKRKGTSIVKCMWYAKLSLLQETYAQTSWKINQELFRILKIKDKTIVP